MPNWVIVLIAVFAVIAGFFIGVIFQKKRKRKEKSVGNLMIVDTGADKEPPYMFLELYAGVNDICTEKSIILDVKHTSQK